MPQLMLTQPQKLAMLGRWHASGLALSEQCAAFAKLTGYGYEAPLLNAIWRDRESYTDALSALLDDKGDWLSYFENECDMGRAPKEVRITSRKAIKLTTVKQLLKVIEA